MFRRLITQTYYVPLRSKRVTLMTLKAVYPYLRAHSNISTLEVLLLDQLPLKKTPMRSRLGQDLMILCLFNLWSLDLVHGPVRKTREKPGMRTGKNSKAITCEFSKLNSRVLTTLETIVETIHQIIRALLLIEQQLTVTVEQLRGQMELKPQ